MKVSLIIFSWNEIEGMKVIMPQIKKEWYDELIVVDGGSTDGTIEYAREHGYFIFVQKEKGAGSAFLESIEKATGDVIVIFSPDGNKKQDELIIDHRLSKEDTKWEGMFYDAKGNLVKNYEWQGQSSYRLMWEGKNNQDILLQDSTRGRDA